MEKNNKFIFLDKSCSNCKKINNCETVKDCSWFYLGRLHCDDFEKKNNKKEIIIQEALIKWYDGSYEILKSSFSDYSDESNYKIIKIYNSCYKKIEV